VNENQLFIIGGTNSTNYFNDVYILDLKTKQFHNVDYKGNFISRAHHTTIFYEMNLFIFGGGNDQKIFNDIQCIDVDQMKNQPIQPTSNTVIPTQKMNHTAEVIGNKMVCFLEFLTFFRSFLVDAENISPMRFWCLIWKILFGKRNQFMTMDTHHLLYLVML
jgi:hypothetical protein